MFTTTNTVHRRRRSLQVLVGIVAMSLSQMACSFGLSDSTEKAIEDAAEDAERAAVQVKYGAAEVKRAAIQARRTAVEVKDAAVQVKQAAQAFHEIFVPAVVLALAVLVMVSIMLLATIRRIMRTVTELSRTSGSTLLDPPITSTTPALPSPALDDDDAGVKSNTPHTAPTPSLA